MEKENKTFRLLYVIGIILVVTSHTAGGGYSAVYRLVSGKLLSHAIIFLCIRLFL